MNIQCKIQHKCSFISIWMKTDHVKRHLLKILVTDWWFYSQYMTRANCSQRLRGRRPSEFSAFHTVLLLLKASYTIQMLFWDQLKEIHFHWNWIDIKQLKLKDQLPYQHKHSSVLIYLWCKQAVCMSNTCKIPQKLYSGLLWQNTHLQEIYL